jgi:uncharacterized membrane protein
MARTSRKKSAKADKVVKPVSFMAMCISCGLFIGFGLGVMARNVWILTMIGLVAGVVGGYLIDKRNGIPYTRAKQQ